MVKHFSDSFVSNTCWILSGERVVNLKENLNILFVVMDISITSIDEAGNGRLRHPSHGLIEDRPFNTIEEVGSVAEDIFDILATTDLMAKVVLPDFDFRELAIIPLLDAFDFRDVKTDSTG